MQQGKMTRPGTLWVLSAVLLTSPICLIFICLGRPGAGRAAWFLTGVIVIAAKVRWDLHDRGWFWALLTTIATLHLALVISVPWTSKWVPASTIAPFCALEGVAILGLIQLVEKWVEPGT